MPLLILQACRQANEGRTAQGKSPVSIADSLHQIDRNQPQEFNTREYSLKKEGNQMFEPDETTVHRIDSPAIKRVPTELIFQTGFESNTQIVDQNSKDARFSGSDYSKKFLNHWHYDLEDHHQIGYVNIQYQGGNLDQRAAEIINDPTDKRNRVLKFWIKEPNLRNEAGRIQKNVYENSGIKALEYSVRLYLPKDLERVCSAPFRVKWLTLMEFWNNANWTEEPYPYRITVNLQKWSKEYDSLKIGIKSQIRDKATSKWKEPHVWEFINHDFSMPLSKWMDIDIYFQEGDQDNGRFVLTITPEGEDSVVVHDIRHFTHHPEDPSPDGLSHFNPLKLYTSSKLIEHVNRDDHLLHIYWDDFRLRIGKEN